MFDPSKGESQTAPPCRSNDIMNFGMSLAQAPKIALQGLAYSYWQRARGVGSNGAKKTFETIFRVW